jgi:glutathione S-transferase
LAPALACHRLNPGVPPMKLYHSPTTPYGRKVMVVLHETGLAGRVEVIEVTGTPLATGSLPVTQNPLGKIPALVRDNGRVIYDSRVICRYLDDLSHAGLYGDGEALWDVLTLEATADGILDAALLMTYEVRLRPEAIRFPEWVEAQWAKIARALDAVERDWMAHLAGPLRTGHIGVGCALGYIDFRHGMRNWRAGRPALTAWEAEFSARPSMAVTRPVG